MTMERTTELISPAARLTVARGGKCRQEHGDQYAVPDEVLRLVADGVAEDCSWHNDTCPRFSRFATAMPDGQDDDNRVDLWVEHPVAESRENDGPRFCVGAVLDEDHGDPVCCTDDVTVAVAVFVAFRFPARPIAADRCAAAADRLEIASESVDDLERMASGEWTLDEQWTVSQCLDHEARPAESRAIRSILWDKQNRAIGRA